MHFPVAVLGVTPRSVAGGGYPQERRCGFGFVLREPACVASAQGSIQSLGGIDDSVGSKNRGQSDRVQIVSSDAMASSDCLRFYTRICRDTLGILGLQRVD